MTHPDIYRCEVTGYRYGDDEKIFSCDVCDGSIYDGDDYYDFAGDIVCEDCIGRYMEDNYRRCAGR